MGTPSAHLPTLVEGWFAVLAGCVARRSRCAFFCAQGAVANLSSADVLRPANLAVPNNPDRQHQLLAMPRVQSRKVESA